MVKNGPLVLMILDGWGYNKNHQHNAIAQAHTPQWDKWWQECPHILLDASGLSVGLPDAQMGNSEVGHMHIGAGRIIQQDFTRINTAIDNEELDLNPQLKTLTAQLKKSANTLHIMGLLSPGGVHSHEEHLFELIAFCYRHQITNVCLHLFLDGRDTPPQSALNSIQRLDNLLVQYPVGEIKSICGRYYAMDRDKRWERVEPVYDMLTQGLSNHQFGSATIAVQTFYQQQITDEFIPPTLIGSPQTIEQGDAILFFNFRADRARQLTAAFVDPNFSGFNRTKSPQLSFFITMTQYDKNLSTSPLFPPVSLNNTLGEVLANHGLKQARIAETEKYAHVTFFFNGGQEPLFPNEQRVLIPSPKVATYDLQPEMSAPELTAALINLINTRECDVIICNFANADMVGHSGNFAATIKAIECLDLCMNQVWEALAPYNGHILITADHGNAEEMFDDQTHQPHTAHTSEPVPLLFIGGGWRFKLPHGSLTDIAPTMLRILGINPPSEMTGTILMEPDHG